MTAIAATTIARSITAKGTEHENHSFDQEAAKNELLWKAVEDAKTKAKVLSQAVGVILKEIQTIDYSWGEVRFDLEPVDGAISRCEPLSAESYKLDIEPDDIDASDTVTVVWEIE